MSDLSNTPRSARIQEGEQRSKLARLGARVVEILREPYPRQAPSITHVERSQRQRIENAAVAFGLLDKEKP